VSAPCPEAEFEVRTRGAAGSKHERRAVPDEGLLIGRSGSCGLVLSQPGVAPVHARLRVLGALGVLEDLRSAGGTRVNGRAVSPAGSCPLRSGDALELGEAELAVTLHMPPSADGVRRALAGGGNGRVWLLGTGRTPLERRLVPGADLVVVRRGSELGLASAAAETDEVVLRLTTSWSGTRAECPRSAEGVSFEGRPFQAAELAPGDALEIAGACLVYVGPGRPRAPSPAEPPQPTPNESPGSATPAALDPKTSPATEISGTSPRRRPLVGITIMAIVGLVVATFVISLLLGA